MFDDFELARRLQEEEFKAEQRDVRPNHSKNSTQENNGQSTSLIDPSWEVIDPNPNIHSLFQAFDRKYFWNSLGSVEVKWSPRMYSCAGICTYKGRAGCVVSLSLPLLKLRPRKDLIETLLHEMIHAYLFLTKNDRDRDGHGPQFHKHMYRINAEAGTRISVYHTFHDEVRHYKTHWWRCDGPCRSQKPFYGFVKRAMNRAPGPSDFWYAGHQRSCGGAFVKIQEPEGFKSKKKKGDRPAEPKPVNGLSNSNKNQTDIRNFLNSPNKDLWNAQKQISPRKVPASTVNNVFKGSNEFSRNTTSGVSDTVPSTKKGNPLKALDFPSSGAPASVPGPGAKVTSGRQTNISGIQNNSQANVNKVNGTSNIHGFGSSTGNGFRGGLKSNMGGTLLEHPKTMGKRNTVVTPSSNSGEVRQVQPFSGTGYVLATPGTTIDRSKSKLLSLYSPTPKKHKTDDSLKSSSSIPYISCPVCGVEVDEDKVNEHLDSCVQMDLPEEPIDVDKLPPSPSKSLFAKCPVCDKSVFKTRINEHVDECIQSDSFVDSEDTDTPSSSSGFSANPPSPSKKLFANCPVCDKKVFKNKMDEHLDSCIRLDSIMDSSGCEIVDLDDDESDGRDVRCPCCDKVFKPGDINAHLDTCLQHIEFE